MILSISLAKTTINYDLLLSYLPINKILLSIIVIFSHKTLYKIDIVIAYDNVFLFLINAMFEVDNTIPCATYLYLFIFNNQYCLHV